MESGHFNADEYFKQTFGKKMFRLSLEGGYTCPNRDGKAGTGGCIFCSAEGSGDFAAKRCASVKEQIENAKTQVARKLPKNGTPFGYVAYFQSFTSTYAPLTNLASLFGEAIRHPEIEALFIATRPDCLPEEVLDLLASLAKIKPVYVELGLQTAKPESADYINRCYENTVFEAAVAALHARHIPVIVHCILGLPYETIDDMKHTVDYICSFGVHGIKLQLLHVLQGTALAADYERLSSEGAFAMMERETYLNTLVSLLHRIPKDTVIYRLTGDGPRKLLIAPLWSTDKKKLQNEIHKKLKESVLPCNPNP